VLASGEMNVLASSVEVSSALENTKSKSVLVAAFIKTCNS
jgi:hypothetical protein